MIGCLDEKSKHCTITKEKKWFDLFGTKVVWPNYLRSVVESMLTIVNGYSKLHEASIGCKLCVFSVLNRLTHL